MRITLTKAAAFVASCTLLAGCNESTAVPNYNDLSAEQVQGGLNRSKVQLLATGLLVRDREAGGFQYVVFPATLGRDIYRLDPAEPRYISETIGGSPDPGGFVGGGQGGFTFQYNAIRTANTLIDNVDASTGLSTAEKSATKGFARTFKALAYLRTLELRDSVGIPIDVNRSITDSLAPLLCKPSAAAAISALLDSAYTDLQAGGEEFPFTLTPGFASNGSFNTPPTFATFNRGLKGKVEVYRGLDAVYRPAVGRAADRASFNTAITAFGESFLSLDAPLDQGLYYTYSAAPGDLVNPIADNVIYLNPSVAAGIEAGDKRASKFKRLSKTVSGRGVKTDYQPTLTDPATSQTRPRAILRNAELILLRAQAEIELGDLLGATRDVNAVRVGEGGLAPKALFTSKTEAIDAVLYEKRYSLLLEGAQRLVDLRAYGRLNKNFLTPELPGDVFTAALPIPSAEANARGGNLALVCQ